MCCDRSREGVEKKLKYGMQGEAAGPLHHAMECPVLDMKQEVHRMDKGKDYI